MKWVWQKIGNVAFWVTLPALIMYLSRGPRTRILITSGSKVVVVKGWLGAGKWILPGGGLHKNEAPLDGVIREAKEEVGIHLDPAQVKLLMSKPYRFCGIHYLCHYFVAELPHEVPLRAQLGEIIQAEWINRHSLSHRNSLPDVITALGGD